MRDPDGNLIEVGQYTEVALNWFKNHPSARHERMGDTFVQLSFLPSLWLNRNDSKRRVDRSWKTFFVEENTPCLDL